MTLAHLSLRSFRTRLVPRQGAATAVGCLLVLAGMTPALAGTNASSPGRALTPAHADHGAAAGVTTTTTVTDPDDVDGRFDIESVQHVVSEADRDHVWISYTVATFPSWVDGRLDRRWRTFVLELNRDGERGSEMNVTVSKRDGHIVAELISNATRQVIRDVRVSRADAHTFTISGPRRLLGARSYFWTSNFHADAPRTLCGRQGGYPVTCQDSVPNAGWIRLSKPAWPTTR
ncbi:MAG: hypothetical protein WAK18_09075 [Nocardioidaceae bacterium]